MTTKSMRGIFNDLTANRRDARDAACNWEIYRVLKSGKISAKPSFLFAGDEAAVAVKVAYWMSINPGVIYVAKAR